MKMELDVHKYEQYVSLCEALNVEPLTFEEMTEYVDKDKFIEHAKEIEDKSQALGNAGKFIAGGFNKIWMNPGVQNTVKRSAADAINAGRNFIRGMAFGAGHNAIIDIVDVAAGAANDFISGGGGKGNGGNNRNGTNPMGTSDNSAMNSLQFKNNPMELRLDTGILNRVWTNTILAPSDIFTPMHMTRIDLSLGNLLSNGEVQAYFNKAFYAKLLNLAQSKVNFSVANLNAFSDSNIQDYFTSVMYGLNAYFYYTSILGYFDNPANNNYAMNSLREKITPDIMNQLVILQRQLTACPVPPKLMNFMYYLNGNFKANHLDGSAIIKFETVDMTVDSIKEATDNLKDLEQTASLLSRIFPEWMNQDLPSYPGTCFHDYTFNTIWTNAPYSMEVQGAMKFGPFIIESDDGSIAYQTFTSELDGAAMALVSIHTNGQFTPGLITPQKSLLTSEVTSRISYTPNGWVNSSGNTHHAIDRADTYPCVAVGTSTLIDPSIHSTAEPVRSVNLNVVRQACFDFIDFMAAFESVASYDSPKENKAKSRRRRK